MRIVNSNETEDPVPYLEKFLNSKTPPKPDEIDWLLILKWAMKHIKKESS